MESIEEEPHLRVRISPFAARHYIKKLRKKYGEEVWKIAQESITKMCSGIPTLIRRGDGRVQRVGEKMYKIKFVVAQTNESYKGSGNRCIVHVDEEISCATVLLVYHKNHLPNKQHETEAWKSLIRKCFPEMNLK